MMRHKSSKLGIFGGILLFSLFLSCSHSTKQKKNSTSKMFPNLPKGTFGYAVGFLKNYTNVIVLKSKNSKGDILVAPQMQGRVMTSTVAGMRGKSLGWINYKLIASEKTKKHITPYGGEDRFWLGPEGGQYSLFFKPGKKFLYANWYVPTVFDTASWKMISHTKDQVTVEKSMVLRNYANTVFKLNVKRTIKLLGLSQIKKMLHISIPSGVHSVAYESENTITNTGDNSWTKKTGAPAVWILSQFTPSPNVTVIIPYRKGTRQKLGPIATESFFKKFTSKRLKVAKGIIYFKTDGMKRLKLGVSPRRALGVEGSYDARNHILTILQYNFPKHNDTYVNQLWIHQKHPFRGNVEFAYNDGPLKDGSQLGPFFEMESTSPAALLSPWKSLTHDHRIFHFSGNMSSLNKISVKVLGVSIQKITKEFE